MLLRALFANSEMESPDDEAEEDPPPSLLRAFFARPGTSSLSLLANMLTSVTPLNLSRAFFARVLTSSPELED